LQVAGTTAMYAAQHHWASELLADSRSNANALIRYACEMCPATHLGRLAHHSACQALHQSLTARQLQQFSVGGLAAAVCMLQLCKKKRDARVCVRQQLR
jgi:hypothetical protein